MVNPSSKLLNYGNWLLPLACLISCGLILRLQWPLPPADFFNNLNSLPIEALLVREAALPRMLMALLAGGSLALASTLLQQAMRNPLAADSTLAVSSGAQTALLLATLFAPTLLIHGSGTLALAGALCSLLVVLWLSAKRSWQPLSVVLIGLVVSLYLGAVNGILMLFYSEEARGVMLWGSGSLVQDGWYDSFSLAWRMLAALMVLLFILKPLSIMALGDEQAQSLGIPVRRIRLITLAIAAVLAANVVALVGMMGFVGLAAAAAVRQLGVNSFARRCRLSWLWGASILLLSDNLLVLLQHYAGIELPTGSVTALLGAPILLWLMLRHSPPQTLAPPAAPTPASNGKLLPWLPLIAALIAACALLISHHEGGWQLSGDAYLLTLRYPRILLAASCGAVLAICGVLLQKLTHNPMASPELLGISSAAGLGAMASVMIWRATSGSPIFWLAGLSAALAALSLMMWLNRKNGLQPEKILLTGMALAALNDAAIRVWSASGDYRIQQLLVWLSGTTYHAEPLLSMWVAAAALLLFILVRPLAPWLTLMGLGATTAQAAGLNVLWARRCLIILSAVMTAFSTLLIGPLSFIGLLAPHLAHAIGARSAAGQLSAAALIGASVMMAADWLGRIWLFPYEIPAGLMASLLGGLYFLWLMRKS